VFGIDEEIVEPDRREQARQFGRAVLLKRATDNDFIFTKQGFSAINFHFFVLSSPARLKVSLAGRNHH
jgi:hypothetical protein